MSPAARILDRLARVKQTRPNQFAAACPCCQSRRGRPISVRELDDGRVLIHAFCGCETSDVLAVLNLSVTDLFDGPLGERIEPSQSRVSARDVLELISHEISAAVTLLTDAVDGRVIEESDWQRVAAAASRIGAARDYVHGR